MEDLSVKTSSIYKQSEKPGFFRLKKGAVQVLPISFVVFEYVPMSTGARHSHQRILGCVPFRGYLGKDAISEREPHALGTH